MSQFVKVRRFLKSPMRSPINFTGSAQGDEAEEEKEEEENTTAGGGRRVIVGNGYDFIRTRSPGRLWSARDERCGGDAGRHI